MIAIIAAHFVAGIAAPAMVRLLGRWAFLIVAAVPTIGLAWAARYAGDVRAGEVVTEQVGWVGSLNMRLDFAMGSLQWVLTLVVLGIGALVLGYCAWYFTDEDGGLGRFAGVLTAFVGAMLGLVLTDDLLVLYVFWELTTIFSYLLIGQDPEKPASRHAAMEALLVTTFGGLAMLTGVLMLGAEAGTHRISELLADPPDSSATVVVAVLLVLVGALSKSALFPFHFWLPGAMAAPTPVSAYLHAASMVKAGVYLVALLAPAFAHVPGWRPVLLGLGALTMLIGGWRALRQYDVKLLLAYGTVSQLGFLVVVLSVGTRSAAVAGLGLLLAHALFKATLFLVVGVVDKTTGTRDLRELSGLGRHRTGLLMVALLGGLSMAGVAPLLGFVAKESAYIALLDVAATGDGTGVGPLGGWTTVVAVVLGSVLTVAYTARFLWGAFATKPGCEPTASTRPAVGFLAAPALLAVLGVVLGLSGSWLTHAVEPYARLFDSGRHAPELSLWHGPGLPLLFSALTLVLGLLLFRGRESFAHLQGALSPRVSTERGYRAIMRWTDRTAVEVTGWVQRGSVATYLAIILLVVLVLPGGALVLGLGDVPLRGLVWDSVGQPVVGAVVVLAAFMAARSRRRLRAVVLLGVTGYGTALLFLVHGAPDIALTQILVETVTLVVFVLVLRRLPEHFTDRPLSRLRYLRVALGVGVGAAVAGFLVLTTSTREHAPVSDGFAEAAYELGGGKNIVNVTLVDIRAWDTFGEISVLVAAATGVASLIFIDTRLSGIRRVYDIPYPKQVERIPTRPGRPVWLPGPRTLPANRRSIIFEVVTRLIFHTVVVFSVYLLLAGHNLPGGGFAAGMVTGLALAVRYLVGGKYELNEAAPVDAGILMGLGLFVAAVSALVPMLLGGQVLQSAIFDLDLGPLGELHLVTSTGFDIGVYLVVVALILDLLRTFGAHLDRQIDREQRQGAAV